MFSSIDPCAPLTCDFLAINFPPHELQTCILSRAPLLSANQRFLCTCFLITSQSAPSCFTVHALVDRPQSISTHNSVLARLERLFPLPPSTFISHFQGLPFLGVALYIGAYVLSASFVTSYRHVFS